MTTTPSNTRIILGLLLSPAIVSCLFLVFGKLGVVFFMFSLGFNYIPLLFFFYHARKILITQQRNYLNTLKFCISLGVASSFFWLILDLILVLFTTATLGTTLPTSLIILLLFLIGGLLGSFILHFILTFKVKTEEFLTKKPQPVITQDRKEK